VATGRQRDDWSIGYPISIFEKVCRQVLYERNRAPDLEKGMIQETAADERRRKIQAMVQFHIRADVSELISAWRRDSTGTPASATQEALTVRRNYEEAARAAGYQVQGDCDNEFFWAKKDTTESSGEYYGSPAEAWIAACETARLSAIEQPVLEHYIVTSWMADKLFIRGEAIVSLHGLQIWGRTTNVVPVARDPVMRAIHLELARNEERVDVVS